MADTTGTRAGRPGDRLRFAALAVLAVPGIAGAVLSWESMRTAAAAVFGLRLAVLFPALVDALALGAALRWVASVRDGAPIQGWRLTAHAAVGASILLNALAADSPGQIPWHVTAPAVWSALVELFAADMAGAHRHETGTAGDRIPARLWVVAPRESARTWLRQARTGQTSAITARIDADRVAAAATAVRTALPGPRQRRTRGEILRRLAAGSLPPGQIPVVIGWISGPDPAEQVVIRAATRAALGDRAAGPRRSDRPGRPLDPIVSGPIEPSPIGSTSIESTPIGAAAGRIGSVGGLRSDRIHLNGSGPSVARPAGLDREVRSGASVGAEVNGRPAAWAAASSRTASPARPGDVAALRAAIAAGDLPARPSVEAVRTYLRISPSYARAAKAALTSADQT